MDSWGLLGDPFAARAAEVAAAGYSTRVIGGEDERTVWGRAGEDGWRELRFDPEADNDVFVDWLNARTVLDVTIDGQEWRRLGDLDQPNIAVKSEFLPQVREAAVWNPTYGYVLPLWQVSEFQHASYTGGGRLYLDPVLHAIAPNVYQPHVEQEKLAGNAPIILAALITMGAASGAFGAFTVVEGGVIAGAAEGAALVGAGELAAAEAPAAFSSGAPLFSAEAAAAEAFTFPAVGSITPAAGEFGGPLMFSAEHAAAGAFGGEFFAPAVVELGGASLLSQAAELAAKAKTAVSPLLAGGRLLRSALGGDAPGAGRPGFVAYGEGGASFASDLLWTVAPLVAAFAVFKFARG